MFNQLHCAVSIWALCVLVVNRIAMHICKNCIPKMWGFVEQNLYRAFTCRPFFFQSKYKRRKGGLVMQDYVFTLILNWWSVWLFGPINTAQLSRPAGSRNSSITIADYLWCVISAKITNYINTIKNEKRTVIFCRTLLGRWLYFVVRFLEEGYVL